MVRRKIHVSAVPVVLLFALLVLTAAFTWPMVVSKATYAIERGKAQASQEQLATATDLSEAFHHVSQAIRPSVVSISSVKRVRVERPHVRRYGGEMPEEFRRFFGDDFFDRFFFEMPSPPRGFEQHGLGTGVIVSEDGYILTNNHVVADADEVSVTLSDKRQFTAKLVGTDESTDIAVLKIDTSDLVAAKLGDSDRLKIGEWVLAIGSPFGLDHTVTAGIISAKGRANVGLADYEDFLQTDAAINPGNSGGPLVNLKGEVVGINTAIASRTGGYMGIGFAIPANMARHVMDSIVKEGHVTRGWLGALIQDLNDDLAESFGYDSTEGVLIGDVVADGPAEKAGLQSGDIVVKFNGKDVHGANEFRNAVAATSPGREAKLEVFRDGKHKTITVEIGQLEQSKLKLGGSSESAVDLGMTVETLTSDKARELGFDSDEKGVVVTDVEEGSLAARVGIQPKDVIVSVGGEEIGNVTDFRDAMRDRDPKKGIRMQVKRDGVRRFVFIKSNR